MDITFGPVPSRRLGRSLGINNIPPKICSYACVYCQLGNTLKMKIDRASYYSPQQIFKSVAQRVQQVLAKGERIDYLAFVPDGEPTLDINLGRTIDLLKSLDIPIAVINNSSLIYREDVRKDLLKADWVSFKIDAGDKNLWEKIDRPHGKVHFEDIKKGILTFKQNFTGILATETMLINGLNDSIKKIEAIAILLKYINPQIAYIAIPTRPPAEKNINPASPTNINRGFQIISSAVDKVELLTGYEGNAFSFSGNARKDILSITSVHPMREDAVASLLKKSAEHWSLIDNMVSEKELIRTQFNGKTFFLRNF